MAVKNPPETVRCRPSFNQSLNWPSSISARGARGIGRGLALAMEGGLAKT